MTTPTFNPNDVLWDHVLVGDDCWEVTTPSYHEFGYCHVKVGRDRPILAHRYSWEIHYGLPPKGIYVCHHCDNPRCVRPDHLFLGTAKDNMQDAKRKGRIGGIGKWNAAATHCPKGHPYDAVNTRWYEGRRYCRACGTERTREEYRRLHDCVAHNSVRDGTRTHCLHGHPWVASNIQRRMNRGKMETICRECRRLTLQAYYRKKRGQA